jgi:hypothetical protein
MATAGLEPGAIYAYDLAFTAVGSEPSAQTWTLLEALQVPESSHGRSAAPSSISYFGHELPTFSLPPHRLDQLQIVHGSCRKPHGKGLDALPIVDELIAYRAQSPNARPHQLFFTGDQIYGDDVADPLLWMLNRAARELLGWEEVLPASVERAELLPGQRSQIADTIAGLTAGLPNQPDHAKSHLFALGEYCTIYLFTWSPVLWEAIPPGHKVCATAEQAKRWDQEARELRSLQQTLGKVRRLLANVSTYMIFDDHDVSDDWYLNQTWCLRVLGQPLGRRAVQNGLLAYALFQAWGNTPEQFMAGQVGEKLLQAIARWCATAGSDAAAQAAIERYLGLPPQDRLTGLPQLRPDRDVLILDHDPEVLNWHYTIRSTCHEVIVLDTRTWRGYPTESPSAPPMLLSPSAFDRQLRQPLRSNPVPHQAFATIVIAPTNMVSLHAIDWIQQWNVRQRQMFKNDVGDAWNVHRSALAQLLTTLFEQRDRVTVLTGDIHYGSAVRFTYWPQLAVQGDRVAPKILAQLTCSALENAEWKTQVLHTRLKSLLPERSRSWVGWNQPPELEEIRTPLERAGFDRLHPPDWGYRIDWMPREPAQTPPWGVRLAWLPAAWQPRRFWQRLLSAIALLWRNRWVQEGSEVVGLTNVGVVQFQSGAAGQPPGVVQDLYWCPPWQPQSIVSSRFQVSLQRSDTEDTL